jgi:demethylmenaquinone methyltransferase / 2-methoxy-6-polyprenyl-1,4-benzoquinol methylase
MFDRIAPRYDWANRVLSFGVDRSWRRTAVRAAGIQAGHKVLDVATGTADLALALEAKTGTTGRVVGLDFSRNMLQEGARKVQALKRSVPLVEGDALHLPFPDDAFDSATIAFGIRNVDDPQAGVTEMARVVRGGGRVVILEFGQPNRLIAGPYRFYSRHLMPRIGAAITGDKAAYEYLPETAARFPSGDAFAKIMQDTGRFQSIKARSLTGGIAYLYVGMVE